MNKFYRQNITQMLISFPCTKSYSYNKIMRVKIYIKSKNYIFDSDLKRVLSTESPFEFVFSCCEFTKVILKSKSLCEMLVLKFLVYKYIHTIKFQGLKRPVFFL